MRRMPGSRLLSLGVLFAAAALVFAFGCAKEEARTTGGVVKVSFWHAMGGPLGDALDGLVAELLDNQVRSKDRLEGTP